MREVQASSKVTPSFLVRLSMRSARPDLEDQPRRDEVLLGQVGQGGPEALQGKHDPLGILGRWANPDVDVTGCSGYPCAITA